MFPKITPQFEAYIAPARTHPQLWRLAAGLMLVTGIYLAFTIFVAGYAARLGGSLDRAFTPDGGPLATSAVLFTFAGMGIGVIVAARLLHNRNAQTLFGPDPAATRWYFNAGASIALAVATAATMVGMVFYTPEPNLPFVTWLIWLPSSLVLILIQSGSEELLFRGYLMQQLAARFRSPWFWWVLPSALFAMLHYDPAAQGPNAPLFVLDIFIFALLAGDLTARTGNIGAAIGLHFVNNAMAFLFIALKGELTGLALHLTPFAADDWDDMRTGVIADIVMLLVIYAVYRRLMRRAE
ncbi:MAG: CPBP family intramembrane metalloprotease [Rhodobacteraceae bacterium]|nr:CPBP family intramembrane metalloprotease [Paracoccaceae bacterium]